MMDELRPTWKTRESRDHPNDSNLNILPIVYEKLSCSNGHAEI